MDISGILTPSFAVDRSAKSKPNELGKAVTKDVLAMIRESGGLREYAEQIKIQKIKEQLRGRILQRYGVNEENFAALERQNPKLFNKITADILSVERHVFDQLLGEEIESYEEKQERREVLAQALPDVSAQDARNSKIVNFWV